MMLITELLNITLLTVYFVLVSMGILVFIVFLTTFMYAVVMIIYRFTGKLGKLYRILEEIETKFKMKNSLSNQQVEETPT